MLVAGPELRDLIEQNVINALPENINGASIDVRLGHEIRIESAARPRVIDLEAKQTPTMERMTIPEQGLIINPGEFFLAHTIEEFNLPDTISADFMLRSSVARAGLEHLHAGFADPGFHGAQLTLEFFNVCQYHRLRLKPGMRIGQLRFFRHGHAGDYSYRIRGRYNGQRGVQQSKGTS